jgi:hypothetical protein
MVVAAPDSPVAKKLDVKAPAAVLATPEVTAIERSGPGEKGQLNLAAIEKMVGGELKKRDDTLKQQFEEGKTKAKAGDKEQAVALLKSVYNEKCLFPKRAKEAARS